MNKMIVVVLCLAVPLMVYAGDSGYKVTYERRIDTRYKSGNWYEIVY